jgi:PAS domain S-box-containing protein
MINKYAFIFVLLIIFSVQLSCTDKEILNKSEQLWLNKHPNLVVGISTNAPPYQFINKNGELSGLFVDFLDDIEKNLHYKFNKTFESDFSKLLDQTKNGEVDVLLEIQKTEERKKFLNFTPSLFSHSHVIVVRNNNNSIKQLTDLEGKTIAVVNLFAIQEYLNKNYPDLKQLSLNDDLSCLRAVSTLHADAFICQQAIATYYITQEAISNLKIVGGLDYTNELAIASRKSLDTLNTILTKAVNSISDKDKKQSANKWLFNIETPYYAKLQFWLPIILSALFIFVFTLAFNLFLQKRFKQKTKELYLAKKKAEENEEKFTLIFKNAPLGIVHYDAKGVIHSCNDKFVEIIGTSHDMLRGMDMMKLPDKKLTAALDISLKGSLSKYNDDYHSVKVNKTTPVQIVFAPIFSIDKKVIGGVAIVEDVTENKKYENSLKEQNELFIALNKQLQKSNDELKVAKELAQENESFLLTIFENIPDMIFIKKADDLRFFKFNKAGELLLGYKREELIGKNDYDIFPTEQADFFIQKDRSVFKSKELLVVEEETVNTKSGPKILYTKKIAIKDKDGNDKYLLGISEDITQKKELEKKFITAKEKAEESDRLKTSFLQNMSHEIRTPMNAIMGFSQMLEDENISTNKRKRFISFISKSANQLLTIVNDILTVSALETKQEVVDEEIVTLNDLLMELHSQFMPLANSQKISINTVQTLSDKDSVIYSDKSKLKEILANLLSNAIKFTSEGFIEFGYSLVSKYGRVSQNDAYQIEAIQDMELQFYVKDTGIGIEKKLLKKIFERFMQADLSTTKKDGGTGLGLSISKGFTEMLGGKIWAESEVNKGSTFYFTIPYKTNINTIPTEK